MVEINFQKSISVLQNDKDNLIEHFYLVTWQCTCDFRHGLLTSNLSSFRRSSTTLCTISAAWVCVKLLNMNRLLYTITCRYCIILHLALHELPCAICNQQTTKMILNKTYYIIKPRFKGGASLRSILEEQWEVHVEDRLSEYLGLWFEE